MLQHLLDGELDWTWKWCACESVSWLPQGRSQPDSRRDWRPSPRSETLAGPLDGGISSEPGMTPQLGKSILLPTAASSDSSGSKVQFRRKENKKTSRKVLEELRQNSCVTLTHTHPHTHGG